MQKELDPVEIYYAALLKKAKKFKVGIADYEWFDLSHTHFDMCGFGNYSYSEHRRHLEALFIAYDRARKELKKCKVPHQLFVLVHSEDSAQDALYIHTKNPNSNSQFPTPLLGKETFKVPEILAELVNTKDSSLLVNKHGKKKTYIIQPKQSLTHHSSGTG